MSEGYNPYPRSYASIIFLICSALLFMGAIAIFIWLLVDAADRHFVKNILYAAAFLIVTLGVLIYSLCAYKAPHTASTIMWITIGIGVITFIVGLCLKDSAQSVEISDQPIPVSQSSEIPSDIDF